MAEAVVTNVLQKIGEAAYQEALIQYGAKDKVVWAKNELEWVSAFLKDADAKAKQNLDNRVKQWVKDVKEVAYMIEDVLDKYLVEVQGEPKEPGVLKKICSMPNILVASHRVSKEIDDIKERLSTIEKRTVTYGIEKLSDGRTGGDPANNPVDWPKFPDIDEATVVGFKSHVNQIVQELTDERNLERSVISIVGTGGLGKTTLAKLVYKSASVKSHFASCMWVTISKEYNLMDILKKILKEISGRDISDMQHMVIDDLCQKIHEVLRHKTYLVVLDDVWSTDLWTKLKEVLPEEKNGSRVLITTRSKQVAEVADYRTKPYELEFLNEEKSLELMLRNAFPNRFKEKCPEDLADLATQFSKRCGGLPLALVVMGRILSQKEPDLISWSVFLEKISWHTDGEDCMKIVSTSYEELPPHLKLCFMYFATFPEDWKIKAGPLIRTWIAEGFITQETNEIMEDTAEKYLEELAQRCMVQVTERSCRGAIKYCRVHDILHELAIRKAQEDNFIMVQSNPNNNSTSNSGSSARRIVLHLSDTIPVRSIGLNHRSLTSYGSSLPNTDELRMARVVNLRNTFDGNQTNFELNSLKHLATMRYLRISIDYERNVDTTILLYHAPWKFLQTLDLSNSSVNKTNRGDDWNNFPTCIPCLYSRKNVLARNLHHSFWNNRMLRHFIWSNYNWDLPIMGPPSSAHLENLLTLNSVFARDEWTVKLPYFPCIRKLVVEIRPDFEWAAMTNLMSKLEHLGSLFLWSSHEEPMKDPCITPSFKNFRNMYKLSLYCVWPKNAAIDSSIFPPHLVRLELGWSQLRQDPMPELGKLPCLRFLNLQCNSYVGEQIICSAGGFKCLQQLTIEQLENLKEIKIENGTMPKLNLFKIHHISEMELVPDLQYLANLCELSYYAVSDEFCARLKGEDQYKVQHIPSIIEKY